MWLSRNYLHDIYTTSVGTRDVIWDNCILYEKQELDKIQNEAVQFATGTTKRISLDCLYNEIKWESIEKCWINHKLTLLWKMYTNLTSP